MIYFLFILLVCALLVWGLLKAPSWLGNTIAVSAAASVASYLGFIFWALL